MSKFKVGDYVTPKSQYIGSGNVYKISSYNAVNKKYELIVPGFRKNERIDDNVTHFEWQDYELTFYDGEKFVELNYEVTNPNDIKVTINPDLLINKFPFENELCKIESEEINMKNILEIYKERKRAKIDTEHTEMKKTLKEQDKISQIIAETNKLIQEIEPTRVFPVISSGLYTTETLEKEKQIDEEYKQRLTELDELIEEVEGYFAMTTDFTERKAILRNYDIIDKKGKLII